MNVCLDEFDRAEIRVQKLQSSRQINTIVGIALAILTVVSFAIPFPVVFTVTFLTLTFLSVAFHFDLKKNQKIAKEKLQISETNAINSFFDAVVKEANSLTTEQIDVAAEYIRANPGNFSNLPSAYRNNFVVAGIALGLFSDMPEYAGKAKKSFEELASYFNQNPLTRQIPERVIKSVVNPAKEFTRFVTLLNEAIEKQSKKRVQPTEFVRDI